jgi:hypothetical protein
MEKENITANLSLDGFEEYLKDLFHQEHPMLLDDELGDKFNDWLGDRQGGDILSYAVVYLNKIEGRELKHGVLEIDDRAFKLAHNYCQREGIIS